MSVIKKIVELIKPYWLRVLAGIILSLIVSGITGAIAWLTKPALDVIFVEKKYEYLKFLPLGVLSLFILRGILHFLQSYLMKSAGQKLVKEVRNKLYNHILYLPLSYFNKKSSGIIISRIINDTGKLEGLIADVIKTFVIEVPTVIFLVGVAFYRRWDLTIIMLILLPLIGYNSKKLGKRVKKKSKEVQKRVALITHKIGETILGLRIIKIFNREQVMADKFMDANQNYYREILRVVRLKELTKLVVDVVTGVGIAVILWYGGTMVVNGTITAGDFASIMVAIYMIFSPVKKLGDAYNTLQETRASIERIEALHDIRHEEKGRVIIDGFKKSIKFEKVSFIYHGNDSPVLEDLNITIRPGEVIAIVGRSGVGKSTMVDMIPRFNIPSGGKLTIDDIDINDIEIHSLRKLIGIVSQDVILFNDTVRENIAFGRPDASDEDIIKAARLAYADEFIEKLPEGYNTVIGERGLKLSGGQRQRLAIARAILKNPPILILDEATSSLDAVSEALIQKALERLMKGRTTIVIAHRLSTIKNADRIVVLDKGRITDIGTHEQLMSRNDTYMKLYNAFALS